MILFSAVSFKIQIFGNPATAGNFGRFLHFLCTNGEFSILSSRKITPSQTCRSFPTL